MDKANDYNSNYCNDESIKERVSGYYTRYCGIPMSSPKDFKEFKDGFVGKFTYDYATFARVMDALFDD